MMEDKEKKLYTLTDLVEISGMSRVTLWSWMPDHEGTTHSGTRTGPSAFGWTRETVLEVFNEKLAFYEDKLKPVKSVIEAISRKGD